MEERFVNHLRQFVLVVVAISVVIAADFTVPDRLLGHLKLAAVASTVHSRQTVIDFGLIDRSDVFQEVDFKKIVPYHILVCREITQLGSSRLFGALRFGSPNGSCWDKVGGHSSH